MKWMLALDVGTNSLGWWAYEVTPKNKDGWTISSSIDGGVRLFPDGREPSSRGRVGDSLAVNRRTARGMRRNKEHRQVRIRKLVKLLIEYGLLPANSSEREKLFHTPSKKLGDPKAYNPYKLRSKAAETKVSSYELGRALFHLGLRRGYLSNRKETSDDDGGKLKDRMNDLHKELDGKTLGQYLWQRLNDEHTKPTTHGLNTRPNPIRFSDNNPFFASRGMYREEFQQIRKTQAPHHTLSSEAWAELGTYILEQRPLKPVERGLCEFFTNEPRHWKDTPIGHDFRIYQELNNLRLIDRVLESHTLSQEQWNGILTLLMSQKTVSFGGMRKLTDKAGNKLFPRGSSFNLEGPKRKNLNGHRIAVDMLKDTPLSKLWHDYKESGVLDDIFETLFKAEDDQSAVRELINNYGLSEEEAKALTHMPLARATSNLSRKAMAQLVNIMRDQGLAYHDAVTELYDESGNKLHHSKQDQERYQQLPYYGSVMPEHMLGADKKVSPEINPEKHYGKINNPTVHVALNQIRKLVNTLIDRFGSSPVKVHLEMTRELKRPKKSREEMERRQAKNEKRNNDIRNLLAEEHHIPSPSANDIKKWKLWEELGKIGMERLCPFTGKTISASQLFNGDVEIEHILPFSRTLDNSMSNLTLSFRWANRLKGNKTPFEAFGSDAYSHENIHWGDILVRAQKMPVNKVWRFGPTAMERFEKENSFIARQLTDTAYMARITRRYLAALDGVNDVVTLPGGLTAMVRGKWHLNGILSDDNKKSREDHRHHAVDAAVIGLINRSLLQEISRLSARGADDKVHIRIPDLDKDIEQAIRSRVPTILPSFKPDHSLEGKMFKETAYGGPKSDNDGPTSDKNIYFVTRKPLVSLTAKEIGDIRDNNLRDALARYVRDNKGQKLDKLLADFGREHGIKRVRLKVYDQTITSIPSAPYKGYKPDSYICCDIWKIPPKKKGGKPAFQGEYWLYDEVRTSPDDKRYLEKNGNYIPK